MTLLPMVQVLCPMKLPKFQLPLTRNPPGTGTAFPLGLMVPATMVLPSPKISRAASSAR